MSELDMAIRAVRELQASNRATKSSRCLTRTLKQRRYLPLGDDLIMYVDDDDSCLTPYPTAEGKMARLHVRDDAGFIYTQMYHTYADKAGRVYAIRCPASLTFEDKDHLMVDIPPGSYAAHMASRKAERTAVRSSKPRTADWSDEG